MIVKKQTSMQPIISSGVINGNKYFLTLQFIKMKKIIFFALLLSAWPGRGRAGRPHRRRLQRGRAAGRAAGPGWAGDRAGAAGAEPPPAADPATTNH